MIMDEAQGVLKLYLHSSFAYLTVVEPCLGEPAYSGLVTIDTDKTWNVEALDVDVKGGKRINELTVGNRLRLYFFFTPSPIPDRNMPCSRAM